MTMQIYVNLLNSVKQKSQYSVKLRLFVSRMNSSNQTVNNHSGDKLTDFYASYDVSYGWLYVLKCVSNFPYSTGKAPKRCRARGNSSPYSTSWWAWMR